MRTFSFSSFYRLILISCAVIISSACSDEPTLVGTPTPLGQPGKRPVVSNAPITSPDKEIAPFASEKVHASCNPFFPLALGNSRVYQFRHPDLFVFHEQSVIEYSFDERFTLRADFFIRRPTGENPNRRISYHPSLDYDAEYRCVQGRVEIISYSFPYINEFYQAEGEYLPALNQLLEPNSHWEYHVIFPNKGGIATFHCKSHSPAPESASSATRKEGNGRRVTIVCTRPAMISSPNLLAKFPLRYELHLLEYLGPTSITLEYDDEGIGTISFDIVGKRTNQ